MAVIYNDLQYLKKLNKTYYYDIRQRYFNGSFKNWAEEQLGHKLKILITNKIVSDSTDHRVMVDEPDTFKKAFMTVYMAIFFELAKYRNNVEIFDNQLDYVMDFTKHPYLLMDDNYFNSLAVKFAR